MNRLFQHFTALLLVVLCTFPLAAAEAGKPEVSYEVFRDKISLLVDEQGRMVQREDEDIKILSEAALERFGTVIRAYDSKYQKMEVLSAKIISPDGAERALASDAVTDLPFPAFRDSALYDSLRAKSLSFADVKIGDRIVYLIEVTNLLPYSGGAFWETTLSSDTGFIRESVFQVSVPAGREIKYLSVGNGKSDRPKKTRAGENDVYTWTFRKIKPVKEEPLMPPVQTVSSRVMVSSFEGWNDVQRFFQDSWNGIFDTDEKMKQEVRRITVDATAQEQVDRIYGKIVREKNIIDLGFGVGGYRFRKAADIYGEKTVTSLDAAVLALAFLKEAGIDAVPVFVSSESHGPVYRDLPSVQQFDQLLVQVRLGEKIKWLDFSGLIDTPGYLSADLQGRDGLALGSSSAAFVTTPASGSHENREEISGALRLNRDGSGDALLEIEEYGTNAAQWRQLYASADEKQQQNFARVLVNRMYPRAMVLQTSFKSRRLGEGPFSLYIRYLVPTLLEKTESGYACSVPVLMGGDYAQLVNSESVREYPVVMGKPFQEDKRFHITVGEGLSVLSLPKSVFMENSVGSFQVVCSQEDRVIHYYSRFIVKEPVVSPENTEKIRQLLAEIELAQKEKIVFEDTVQFKNI